LLKFGNPVILDRLIDVPTDALQVLFQPWPVRWGYAMLLACALGGLGAINLKTRVPRWVLLVPCVWFIWQLISSAQTVDMRLTGATLLHFWACLLCFMLGVFCLGRSSDMKLFWLFIILAFAYALWSGLEQHYGGLEATRKMFYQQPNWQQYPPEYLKKIQSNRIFSTLVYPNAFAAAILLLLPPVLVAAWTRIRLTELSRAVVVGLIAYGAAAGLFWSGSKSGWLIALVLVLCVLLRQPFPRRAKLVVLGLVLAAGLAGFFVKYSTYFHRGATSVSARFEYWTAAVKTALAHPLLGTGPGTFSVTYRKIKPAGAEMAQLAHNDYLEQACDSGFPGFAAYAAFVLGSIAVLGAKRSILNRPECFAVWLGLLGWSLQSFVEFLLYIPALTWTAFALFGWLWSHADESEV
jgi:hypothetical protein